MEVNKKTNEHPDNAGMPAAIMRFILEQEAELLSLAQATIAAERHERSAALSSDLTDDGSPKAD